MLNCPPSTLQFGLSHWKYTYAQYSTVASCLIHLLQCSMTNNKYINLFYRKIEPHLLSIRLIVNPSPCIKPTIHYATKLHAKNCTKATKLKQSCNTLVLQFVACNFVA